jgi:DNA-binding NarL/FixJ family response regulator
MVLVSVRDLLFRSKIEAAASRLAVPVRLAGRGVPLREAIRESGAGTLLVDLAQPGVVDEIRAAKGSGALRVVGWLGHLETALMDEARAAGVDEVLTRGQLASRLDEVLRTAGGGETAAPQR